MYVRYHALAAALATTIAQNTDSTTPRDRTLCTTQGRDEEAGVEVEKVELGWSGLGKVPLTQRTTVVDLPRRMPGMMVAETAPEAGVVSSLQITKLSQWPYIR